MEQRLSRIKDFPTSEDFGGNVVDAFTLSLLDGWWSAVFIVKDPETKANTLNLCQWQLTDAGWKCRKKFSFDQRNHLDAFIALSQLLVRRFPLE